MRWLGLFSMKHKKLITIPEKQEERVVTVTCDLCGAEGKPNYEGADWTTESYSTNETHVRWKKGSSYPEGGSGEQYDVHVCPKCFEERLLPWLRTQGAAPIAEEYDY